MQPDKQKSVDKTKGIIVNCLRESLDNVSWIMNLELDEDCLEALGQWKEGLLRAMPHVKEDWND